MASMFAVASCAFAQADVGRDFILEADYLGDVARVYVDGVPVADDFYKGRPLRLVARDEVL